MKNWDIVFLLRIKKLYNDAMRCDAMRLYQTFFTLTIKNYNYTQYLIRNFKNIY